MASMKTRALGTEGPMVSALGVGCMNFRMDNDQSELEAIKTIHAALDAGFSFLNTGDMYGSGQSEMIIGRALRDRRDKAFLSVKFGAQITHDHRMLGIDGRPNSVKNFAAYSLQRLRVDVIDLYQPGRADPNVPYEETIGAVADLIQEGKVRYLGVSEVGADLLRRAHTVHPVSALEIEYSLACRFSEAEILPTARELGIGLVAYRVLADGLLTGMLPHGAIPEGFQSWVPRMQGENYVSNRETAKALEVIAARKRFTAAQLAIAWVLSRGDDIIPLVGISRAPRIADNVAALNVAFTADELAELDRAFTAGAIVGMRYPEFLMNWSAR